tara:strand:- start:4111 stop:5607 length:1497 start_codon:yes stop_codon:yes gene_type:complete
MGLLDSFIQKQNEDTGEGELIDLGLDSKIYYDGPDGVQRSGNANYGNYQFISLEDIINSFIVAYVGEEKIISKASRTDIAFHAQRALAELSFDTLKSVKSFELEVPPSLTLPLPQDYVHYTKLSWVDDSGIKRPIYPTSKTSNPISYQQETTGDLKFETNTWKINIPEVTIEDGYYIIDPTAEKQYFDQYIEYGITRSYDSFGNPITSINNFTSKTPLPQFKDEVRVTIAQNKAGGGQNMIYGVNVDQDGNATNDGMIILMDTDPGGLKVGMSVFGPGIPLGTTITSLDGITSVTYPGIALHTTNKRYQDWKLMDGDVNQPAINPGKPIVTVNSQLYGNEIIFVDLNTESNAWNKYRSHTPATTTDDYEDDTEWVNEGQRYGIDPQHAQNNGSYYIDDNTGLVHFSSFVSGKTVVIDYLSDSLGTDSEMKVHKFAEQAMYMSIAYAILSTKANVQEYIVRRFKKDRFAAVRQAKLRLSNLKLEELTQILRGKSKHIKH